MEKRKKNPESVIFHLKCATDERKGDCVKYDRLIQAFVFLYFVSFCFIKHGSLTNKGESIEQKKKKRLNIT